MKQKRELQPCFRQTCRACNEHGECVALNDTSEQPCKFYKRRKRLGDNSWNKENLRTE